MPSDPSSPNDRAIAAYLTFDIQNSPEWAQDLADHIGAVRQGELSHWERLGNAYALTLNSDGAHIVDTMDRANTTQVSLDELAIAVAVWQEKISAGDP